MPPVLGPASALQQALMVLRDGQQLHVAAVGDRQDRDLLPAQERFDHHGASGLPEDPLAEHRPHRGGGLRPGLTDDRALSGRQSRGLHHQRLPMPGDVFQRRSQLVEGAARRGRDLRGGHHLLGERLRGLELRGRCTGSEDRAALGPEPVGQPSRERHLRAHDGEIDPVHVGGIGQAIEIVGRDREIRRHLRGAGVARRAVDVGIGVLPPKRPAERVLPASGADDEQSHGFWAFLNASRARSAARRAASATWVAISLASPA